MSEVFQRGDLVEIGAAGATIRGMVTLASEPNGKSLMVMFDGMLDGHAGMMPLLHTEHGFIALVTGNPVTLRRLKREDVYERKEP